MLIGRSIFLLTVLSLVLVTVAVFFEKFSQALPWFLGGGFLIAIIFQCLVFFQKKLFDQRVERKIFERFSMPSVLKQDLETKIREVETWSEFWGLEFHWASQRLASFYKWHFNCEVPDIAIEALCLEFLDAKCSIFERTFGKGLERVKWRTSDIGGWLAAYADEADQEEVDKILSGSNY